jgi:hypothetical protein
VSKSEHGLLVVSWGGGKERGLFLLSAQKSFFLGGFLGYEHTSTAFSVAGAPFWKLRDASNLDKIC